MRLKSLNLHRKVFFLSPMSFENIIFSPLSYVLIIRNEIGPTFLVQIQNISKEKKPFSIPTFDTDVNIHLHTKEPVYIFSSPEHGVLSELL